MIPVATVHLVTLAFFTLGTTMLMIVTMSNAMRLRNVRISWKSGKLFGYPIFSSVFLLFTLFLTVLTVYRELNHYSVAMMCYNWIGLNWFVSSLLTSKRFITDHGIVKNINDPSQTVAWNRIMDYVERNDGKNQSIAFFYPDYLSGERTRSIRLELEVPEDKRDAFNHIIHNKLGRRFQLSEMEISGIKQLK